jgi:CRP/FNR family cyclic AMP-dependent transcriptional regulator
MAVPVPAARTSLPQFRVRANPEEKASPHYSFPTVDQYTKCELETSDFFCCLSEAALKALQKIKHTTSYTAGTIVFTEGQAARGVYILCQGQVKLLTTNSDGRTLILKIAKPGEGLGLNSVITGKPYELTAEILQPSQFTFIARADYLNFFAEHTDACLQLGRHLSRDCQSAYDLARSIGLCQPVSERLARFLLKWSSNATARDGGVRVKLGLTHEEIAQLIGATRETVTRTLSEFKKRRLIELNGSMLLLWNKPALESFTAN